VTPWAAAIASTRRYTAPRDTARDSEERDESDTLLRTDAHELVILATGRQAVLVLHAGHGGDRLRLGEMFRADVGDAELAD
jgi:hypothetical protein